MAGVTRFECHPSIPSDMGVPSSNGQPVAGKGLTLTDLVASSCRPSQMRLDSYARLFLCQKELENTLGLQFYQGNKKLFVCLFSLKNKQQTHLNPMKRHMCSKEHRSSEGVLAIGDCGLGFLRWNAVENNWILWALWKTLGCPCEFMALWSA